MVSPCTTEHSSATRPAPDSVIDAVCADPDLLTLEFEAIMAANYPAPADHPQRRPPRTPPASATRQAPPIPPAHPTTRTPERAAPVATPQRHQRARQRGPPTRTHRGLAFDPTPHDPTTPRPERRLRIPTGTGWTSRLPAANTPRLPVCARHPPPPRSGSSPPPQRPPRSTTVTGLPSRTAAVVPRHPRPRSSRPPRPNTTHRQAEGSSSADTAEKDPSAQRPVHRGARRARRRHRPGRAGARPPWRPGNRPAGRVGYAGQVHRRGRTGPDPARPAEPRRAHR
jgi:hypothetical protein